MCYVARAFLMFIYFFNFYTSKIDVITLKYLKSYNILKFQTSPSNSGYWNMSSFAVQRLKKRVTEVQYFTGRKIKNGTGNLLSLMEVSLLKNIHIF